MAKSSDTTLMVRFEGKVDSSLQAAASKVEKDLAQTGQRVEGASKKHGGAMMALATGIGSAAGTMIGTGLTRVVDFVGDSFAKSIAGAGALEQSIGAIDTVFKDNADQMHEWSKSAAQDVGLTSNEFNELGTLIGTQLRNGGTAMEELGPKTKDLIGLGADLSSMFGGSSRQAVEALSSALKGERDPIEKYGVSLTQAKIDAEAAALGFKKVGGSLSGEAQQAATLSLIMQQTADAHGNFAKEADTFEGKQQRLAAGWENFTTSIGMMALPALTGLLGGMNDMLPVLNGLGSGLQGMAGWVQANADVLVPLGVGLGVVTTAFVALDVAQKITMAGGLVKWIASTTVVTQVWTATQWLLNAALNANPLGLVIMGLTALGVGLAIAWNKSETFRNIVTGAWEGIKFAALVVVDWFTKVAWPGISGFISGFSKGFDGLVSFLGEWGGRIKEAVLTPIRWVADNVVNLLLGGIEKVAGVFGQKLNLPRLKFAEGGIVSFADGGIMPGYTPGSDVHRFYSPTGGLLELSGGEPVLRPEVGEVLGSSWVHGINAAARSGGVSAVRSWLAQFYSQAHLGGFAGGGIIPNASQGWRGYDPKALAAIQAWAAATGMTWHMTGNGGARSFADQKRAWDLYQAGRGPLAANPWRGGPHMTPAVAMDLSPRPGQFPSAAGLLSKFGLGLTVRGEPWHVGYLGGRGGGVTSGGAPGGGGGFDPIGMLTGAIGAIAKVQGAGVLGDMLNAIPGRLIGYAGDWLKEHFFDDGGWLMPGATRAVNATGRPEAVLTARQWDLVRAAASGQDLGEVTSLLRELIDLIRDAPLGHVDITANDAAEQRILEEFVQMVRRRRRVEVA